MQALPLHLSLLRPHSWASHSPDPVAYYDSALFPAVQALEAALQKACKAQTEKLRTGTAASRINNYIFEPPLYSLAVPLEIPAGLQDDARLTQALSDAQLLANLALNPDFTGGLSQCHADLFHPRNGTFSAQLLQQHPLMSEEPPEYLKHGVVIQKDQDGEWQAVFLSKDLDALAGKGEEQAAYPYVQQMNRMLDQWRFALEYELRDPQRWREELNSKFEIRRKDAGNYTARINFPIAFPKLASQEIPGEFDIQRSDHGIVDIKERLRLLGRGYSPLMLAVADGHELNLVGLLKEGADTNEKCQVIHSKTWELETAYDVACQNKDIRMIRLMAHYGKPPSNKDAMVAAVQSQDVGVVCEMLKLGAPVDEKAMTAAFKGTDDNVFLHVLQSALPKIRDILTPSALDDMIASKASDKRWQALIEALPASNLGEVLNCSTASFFSRFLVKAAAQNNSRAAHWFLDMGADPAGDYGGPSPLCSAVKYGDIALATRLVEKGAPARRKCPAYEKSPLELALEGGEDKQPFIELFTHAIGRPLSRGGVPGAAAR